MDYKAKKNANQDSGQAIQSPTEFNRQHLSKIIKSGGREFKTVNSGPVSWKHGKYFQKCYKSINM